MKVLNWLKGVLLWVWQFPQNFLAFTVYSVLGYLAIYKGKYKGENVIVSDHILSCFSLGDYIFALPNSPDVSIAHEYGHCKQSEYLGWLYLIVIALPSVIHNLYVKIARKCGKEPNYYNFYTEKWADKLAGISR